MGDQMNDLDSHPTVSAFRAGMTAGGAISDKSAGVPGPTPIASAIGFPVRQQRAMPSARAIAVTGFLAMAGMVVVLLWIYGSYANSQLKFCGREVAGDKVLTVCNAATSDPLAVLLVTGTALIPAATAAAITRRRTGSAAAA
jgi:hypothetical protein